MGVVGQARPVSGALFFWGLLGPFALVVGAQGSFLDEPGLLSCGQDSLQLAFPPGWEGNVSFVLTAWDTEGKAHALHNDSGCGLWVSGAPDGSRKVSVSYTSCYVFEWDGNYLMIVGLEGTDATGQRVLQEEKLLRCPVDLPALDAPSSSVCSAVRSQDRLPCASSPVSQGDCEARGCCYNPRDRVKTCYYGNTVTAHCTPDGQFSIAVSRDVTLPPVILDSVHLPSGPSAGCTPVVKNSAFVVYQFPLSACGTTFQVTGDHAVYENELVASRDVQTGSLGSVTRDSTFRLHVRCSYLITGNFIPLSVQPGPLSLDLIFTGYSSYYTDSDYPVVKALRDPVYVEVRILQRTDPELVLVLHHCWATPSINPHQQMQWPVLVDGCPYAGDNYQTQLVPLSIASGLQFPLHYQRFTLYTFTFVDSISQEMLSGLVYLHCSASVCHRSAQESCTTTCPAGASKCLNLTASPSRGTLCSPTGAAVLAAAPWALGFAAVATVVVVVAAVLRWRKVPVTHEVNALQ
uniref:Zona pellucida sperm-binding protein 4 n=1 Tax=Cairina moschata TaxID=8855 RepID=A0A8C3GQ09_CAIMO